MKTCGVSIVIPIYNEQENIKELYQRLVRAMKPLGMEYELVFVNDYSRDHSLKMLRKLHERNPRVKVVSLARNFGHQTAITAGMFYARGDAVILMDGDLQDPPEILPGLIEKRNEGDWDVVYAIRKKRKENPVIRFMYYVFYRLLKSMSYVSIPVDSGDFCIMSRRVVDKLNSMPERNRFVRGLRSWIGYRQTGLEFERSARFAGKPKYSLRGLFKLAFDGIFSFSYVPLRVSAYLGLFASCVGILYAIYVVINRLTGEYTNIPGWATVIVTVLVMSGIQMVMLGVVGEYLGRIYEETKNRPQFTVDEVIGLDDPPQ